MFVAINNGFDVPCSVQPWEGRVKPGIFGIGAFRQETSDGDHNFVLSVRWPRRGAGPHGGTRLLSLGACGPGAQLLVAGIIQGGFVLHFCVWRGLILHLFDYGVEHGLEGREVLSQILQSKKAFFESKQRTFELQTHVWSPAGFCESNKEFLKSQRTSFKSGHAPSESKKNS